MWECRNISAVSILGAMKFKRLLLLTFLLSWATCLLGQEVISPEVHINFGGDSNRVYSFTNGDSFIDFNKDSTFRFGRALFDTFCNYMCVKGTWSILYKTKSKEKKKKGEVIDTLFLKLSEKERPLSLKLRDGNTALSHLLKPFNDTFMVIYYGHEVNYGSIRRDNFTYIQKVPPCLRLTKVSINILPYIGLERQYIESKYNIEFYIPPTAKESYYSLRRIGSRMERAIRNDIYRAQAGYSGGYYSHLIDYQLDPGRINKCGCLN